MKLVPVWDSSPMMEYLLILQLSFNLIGMQSEKRWYFSLGLASPHKKLSTQLSIDDFILSFYGKLDLKNSWVQLAAIIPWDEFEEEYAFIFPSDRAMWPNPSAWPWPSKP